jgi:hypothetical protein
MTDEEVIMAFIKEIRIYGYEKVITPYGIRLYMETRERFIYHILYKTYDILYRDDGVTKYVRGMERSIRLSRYE